MILFGAPVSHESDAEHAIRCALELNANLAELEVRFHHRIGIATGYVFSGNVGSRWHREYTVIGNAANLAARLVTMAGEGEIVASAPTLHGLEERLSTDSLPLMRVKGFSEPVQAYRVTRWRATRVGQLHPSTPLHGLVGRQAELAQLQTIMAQVRGGQGQVVAITGPAGVGKSALGATLVQSWQKTGGTVHPGSCKAYGERIPYLPWIGVLGSLFNLLPSDTPQVRWHKVAQRVSELAPDWQDRLYILTGLLGIPAAEKTPMEEMDPRLYQQHLYNFVVTLLRACTEVQPLLVMISDLHWSDRASLALMRHVAHNIHHSRLLLFLGYRTGGSVNKLEALEGEITEVVLEELSRRDSRKLTCTLLNCAVISDELMEPLWSFSSGNPLYLKEMLLYLQAQDYLACDETGGCTLQGDLGTMPIPGSIERIIISTLDRLNEPSRQTIKLAAVIGRLFPFQVLKALYPYSPEQMQTALDRLIGRRLVYMDQPVPDVVYAFCEPQVQEVTYATLSFAQRRHLHRQLGHFYEQEMIADLPEHYALLAYHYGLGQEVTKAFECHVKAGDRARKACANHEALYHYRRALEFLPQLSYPPESRVLLGLYRDHGRVCRFLGLYQEAQESYEQGLALARQNNDLLGETEILVWLSDLSHVQGDGQGALEQASYAAKLAEETGDKVLLELSLEYVGGGYMLQGALDEALRYFERCLSLSRALQSSQGIRRSLNNISLIHVFKGQYGPAIAAFREALQLARETQDYFYVVILANNLGELHQELYDTETALALHEEALSMARQFGVRDFQCDSLRNLAVDLAQRGDLSQALDNLKQARALACEAGFTVGEAAILYNLGKICLTGGADSEAVTIAEELTALADRLGLAVLQQKACLLSGLVHQARGQWSQAHTAFQTAIDLWEREPAGPLGWQSYQALGELYSQQGRPRQAGEAFARARQIITGIVESIEDEELRMTFLQASPVHRVLAAPCPESATS